MRQYLVYYGELALKKGHRPLFEKRLMENIRTACRGLGLQLVKKLYGRILLGQNLEGDEKELIRRLQRTYGISHIDPVDVLLRKDSAEDDLEQIGKHIQSSITDDEFDSFAIRCKRVDKAFAFKSPAINQQLGEYVLKAKNVRVDLTKPQREFFVLIMQKEIFVGTRMIKGPGGLPIGCTGRIMHLLSGGIDSPVAAELMLKRGCHLRYIHFHSAPFTDRSSVDKAVEIAQSIAKNRNPSRLYIVPLGQLQQHIVANAPAGYRILLYRRYMLRIAQKFAYRDHCLALSTGENLAQVSSQTLENQVVLDRTTLLPIFRPLLTFDKQEIVDLAKRNGSYEMSIEEHADCCSFLMPRQVVTKGNLEDIIEIEESLQLDDLVASTIKATEKLALLSE